MSSIRKVLLPSPIAVENKKSGAPETAHKLIFGPAIKFTKIPNWPLKPKTKKDIRQVIWAHLERTDIAQFPRPCFNRIPNFKGADQANQMLAKIPEFRSARLIEINPDTPQKGARRITLAQNKRLLVPTPRLRTGLFNEILLPQKTQKNLSIACVRKGLQEFGRPVGLTSLKSTVDCVVIGSVCVSPDGWRIGKGEGYADLEWAMAAAMGNVNENTVVISTVHDDQVQNLPVGLFGEHDLTIDYICTPTRVIKTNCAKPKPTGVCWDALTREKFRAIPVLTEMRKLDRRKGRSVTLLNEGRKSAPSRRLQKQGLRNSKIVGKS